MPRPSGVEATAAEPRGHNVLMKIVIDIPEKLLREVEACSRRLNLSRSRLFTIAAREYLERHGAGTQSTDAWNDAIASVGQPGEDPAALAVRRRNKAGIRTTLAQLEPARRPYDPDANLFGADTRPETDRAARFKQLLKRKRRGKHRR